jgi:hypothetical protein
MSWLSKVASIALIIAVRSLAYSAPDHPRWIGPLDSVGPFEMQDPNGRTWTERDFQGKVVVRIWSAHCAPCIADFPEMQRFYDSLRHDPSVAFVSLNLDASSPELTSFMKELQKEYSFPVLLAHSWFKIGAVPYTWIVDRDGFVRDVYHGAPPDWRHDTLARADAVRRKLPVSSLPPAVLENQRALNAKEGEKTVELK